MKKRQEIYNKFTFYTVKNVENNSFIFAGKLQITFNSEVQIKKKIKLSKKYNQTLIHS